MANDIQNVYVRRHLQILSGMNNEVLWKGRLLSYKMRQFPERVEEFKNELGKLEVEGDAVAFILDFIENWPLNGNHSKIIQKIP